MKEQKVQKLIFKSGFISYGYKAYGGWEHTNPINPDMKDKIIKVEDVKNIKETL